MESKKKILIVEDEKDLVETLSIFFQENGYETIAAYNGHEGYEKAEKENPDLITLDISMDGESGVKMYHKLIHSDKTKNIPVVIVTGASPELKRFITKVKTFSEPAGFFEKPVDREKLLARVKELVQ